MTFGYEKIMMVNDPQWGILIDDQVANDLPSLELSIQCIMMVSINFDYELLLLSILFYFDYIIDIKVIDFDLAFVFKAKNT
jgi:hypothetical protein